MQKSQKEVESLLLRLVEGETQVEVFREVARVHSARRSRVNTAAHSLVLLEKHETKIMSVREILAGLKAHDRDGRLHNLYLLPMLEWRLNHDGSSRATAEGIARDFLELLLFLNDGRGHLSALLDSLLEAAPPGKTGFRTRGEAELEGNEWQSDVSATGVDICGEDTDGLSPVDRITAGLSGHVGLPGSEWNQEQARRFAKENQRDLLARPLGALCVLGIAQLRPAFESFMRETGRTGHLAPLRIPLWPWCVRMVKKQSLRKSGSGMLELSFSLLYPEDLLRPEHARALDQLSQQRWKLTPRDQQILCRLSETLPPTWALACTNGEMLAHTTALLSKLESTLQQALSQASRWCDRMGTLLGLIEVAGVRPNPQEAKQDLELLISLLQQKLQLGSARRGHQRLLMRCYDWRDEQAAQGVEVRA